MSEENIVINPDTGEPITLDSELLKRACVLLDGMLHDASGTITYTGGPNAGQTLPTQEARYLADEFKKIRDAAVKMSWEAAEKSERARIVQLIRDEVAKDTSKPATTLSGKIVDGVMAVAKGTLLGYADRIEAGTK